MEDTAADTIIVITVDGASPERLTHLHDVIQNALAAEGARPANTPLPDQPASRTRVFRLSPEAPK